MTEPGREKADEVAAFLQSRSSSIARKFYEFLVMNANEWVVFLDPSSRVVIWNRAAEEISGYPSADVVGSSGIWKRLYPDAAYRKRVTGRIVKAIENTSTLENFETRITTKQGFQKTISWNTRELRDETGDVLGFIAIGRDITRLVELQTRFKMLLMNANILVAFMDPKNRVLLWNPAAETITGYSADEVFGSDAIWKLLYPDPEYRNIVTRTIREAIDATGNLENLTARIATKQGTVKIIAWNTRELRDEAGEICGYIATGRDITREKQMEADVFSYLSEAAMRLKSPVEVIRDNLLDLTYRIEADEIPGDDIQLHLQIQIRNAEQIIDNLRQLNKAMASSLEEMPGALKKFIAD